MHGAARDPTPKRLSPLLRSSEIGRCLFACLAKRMHCILFAEEIESQLSNLEHLNFRVDEVRTCTKFTQEEAELVQGEAYQAVQKNRRRTCSS